MSPNAPDEIHLVDGPVTQPSPSCLVCGTSRGKLITNNTAAYFNSTDRCDGKPAKTEIVFFEERKRRARGADEFKRLHLSDPDRFSGYWPDEISAVQPFSDAQIEEMRASGWKSDSRELALRLMATIDRVRRDGEARRLQTRRDLTLALVELKVNDPRPRATLEAYADDAREACARICDAWAKNTEKAPAPFSQLTAAVIIEQIAAEIRASKQIPTTPTPKPEQWGIRCTLTTGDFAGHTSWLRATNRIDKIGDWVGSEVAALAEVKRLQSTGTHYKYEARPYPGPPEAP